MAEERDATRGLRTLRFLGAGVLVLSCLVLGFAIPIGAVCLWVSAVPFDDREFEPALWAAHTGSWAEDNPRGQMAYDVRERLLADRPTREGVAELLGEPDGARRYPQRMAYVLGLWRGWSYTLDIEFGEDGRVEQVRIIGPD